MEENIQTEIKPHRYVPSSINTERGKFCRICSHKPSATIHQLTDRDKGEQCVYCGKDSWTCEHFEPPVFDGEDAEEWQRRSEIEGE